uniref:Sulfotransferase 4A1-like n=1 Tax=Saccoglossus kowalevskii TaxID=10224 RepID=A0ABM0M5I0_SACKO|nr:PREDICTED: sulfotransferase 4A1-like [Saccoglossus kowalevskii]
MVNFEVRPDDIWICTYAKSGTSWITEIVWNILSCSGVFTGEEPLDKAIYPEFHIPGQRPGYEILNEMASPRLIVTHLTPTFLPPQLFEVRPKAITFIQTKLLTGSRARTMFYKHSISVEDAEEYNYLSNLSEIQNLCLFL